MTTQVTLASRVLFAAMFLGLFCLLLATRFESAMAQSPVAANAPVATSTPAPTATIAPPVAIVPIISPSTTVAYSRVAIVTLIVVAGLLLAALLAWLMRSENRHTRDWVAGLAKAGHSVSTDQIAAVLQGNTVKGEGISGDIVPAARPPITIMGPTSFAVGEKVVLWVADALGQPTKENVTWALADGGLSNEHVTLSPTVGSFTTIVSTKAGQINLTAAATNHQTTPFTLKVEAATVGAKSAGLKGFFLGEGYGTINLAIFLMSIIAILAILGTIGEGTVSTILGAMAGYIFGVAVVTKTTGSGTGSS